MKNDSENIKKYNLSDLLVNTRKFKDYLDYCKKKNLISEKKALMEELILKLQDKKISQNTFALTEYLNNFAFTIIFSDFEVELFFQIEHFNPDLQKNILFQTINYCCDRQKDLESYISTKFQFWILKMKNYNYAKLDVIKNVISDAEINESIESLKKCLNQENFNKSEENVQILYLKAIYELGVYFYFNNKLDEANKHFIFLEKNMKNLPELQKFLYFDLSSISNILKYINQSNNTNINKKIPDNDNLFELEDTDKIINEDYQKYKNEIIKINKEKIINNNNKNVQEETKSENQNSGMLKYLKISEYLIHMTFENINNYPSLKKYLSIFNEIFNKKVKIYKEENIYMKYIKKEFSYHSIIFQIIEAIINNNKELPNSFIINLSNTIQRNTFTDSLSLSGMIHSSLINFENDYKIIYKYFNDFVEFLNEINNGKNNKEIINQIIFVARIISVIYIIIDSKSKINSLEEKEIIINIENELHLNIINIFLFWLEKDKDKDELKYAQYINIIYILIETLKKIEHLKIYKIIILGVLEYIINKKNTKNKNNKNTLINNNINDYIKQLKPKIFKINSLSEEELKFNKKEINSQNLYFSIKVNFIEAKEKDSNILKQNESNYDFYISKLFEIIELIEDKIKQYEYKTYNQIIVLDNKDENNLNNISISKYPNILMKKDFLYNFYKILESQNYEKKKISNILLIKKGIDYLNNDLNIIKLKYMKNDIINNNNFDINNIYELFKKNINQEILSKLILTLIKNNLILESIVLSQYSKSFNKNLEYALIRAFYDSKKEMKNECFKFIWKINYFEYLANIFNKNNDKENLEQVKMIIKKIGNHRFFKDHPLRKHFKIINFLNFLEYINSILFKI
jgi:hypothetical protein